MRGLTILKDYQKSALIMSLLTLGLFFSGPFVLLTPLPFIYFQLKFKRISYYQLAIPCFLFVVLLYVVGSNFFYNLYQEHPNAYWILPIPFLDLIEFFSHATVKILGVSYFLTYLIISHLIVRLFSYKQERIFKVAFCSIGAVFVGVFILGLVVVLWQGSGFVESYYNAMTAFLDKYITAQQEGLSLHQVVNFQSTASEFVHHSIYLLPFAFFLSLTVSYVLNLVIAKRFFSLSFKKLSDTNLTVFQIPFVFVWGVLAVAILLIFNEVIIQNQLFSYILINVLLALGLAFFFQGIAILICFLNKKKIVGLLRIFILIAVLMMREMALALFTIVGFADSWLDLRKLEKKEKTTSDK